MNAIFDYLHTKTHLTIAKKKTAPEIQPKKQQQCNDSHMELFNSYFYFNLFFVLLFFNSIISLTKKKIHIKIGL